MSTDTWNRLPGQQIVTETGYMGAKYWDGTIKALISLEIMHMRQNSWKNP